MDGTSSHQVDCSIRSEHTTLHLYKLQLRITPCVQVRRLVAATHHSNKLLLVYWRIFVKKLFVCCNSILSGNKSHKFCLISFFCNMLLQQNSFAETHLFSQKFSNQEGICRCDVLRRVPATCSCNLSPGVYRPTAVTVMID